jgi:ADP-ribosylglycohydrolase
MPTREERLSGGLIGLLVGDALGVPYEFHPASALPPRDAIEFDPPAGFARAHRGVAPGTWPDDGAQALCLLASLLHCDRFDPQDFSNRLVNWCDHGYMAIDGQVFDIGIQTSQAIARLRAGVPALEAGGAETLSQGNGSLMRVLPLALWSRGTDEALVRDAQDQSRVTHGHLTVQACCALYCLWARRTLEGAYDAWDEAVAALRSIYRDQPALRGALEGDIRPDEPRTVGGSGYVIDCLFSARQALEAGSYEAVVKAAVALGNDTDTTACVAGGIAGVRDGAAAIPARWRDQLRGWSNVAGLRQSLLDRTADDAEAVTLWRPVGPAELMLIREASMRAFPPRLPDQPIFYRC